MASQFYLASASPRRRQLLQQLGLRFEVLPAEVDETPLPGEAPRDYVVRVARLKVQDITARLRKRRLSRPVLAADTAVVLDGAILGKPRDRAEGLGMLARLAGRRHQVLSAVALLSDGALTSALSESEVQFRGISPDEAAAYWDSGEPQDKAGGYGIQGLGALFVERLEGSYSGVMGLPLFETAALLQTVGVRVL
jgi:septum formation protein